jgi:hypothetical protein
VLETATTRASHGGASSLLPLLIHISVLLHSLSSLSPPGQLNTEEPQLTMTRRATGRLVRTIDPSSRNEARDKSRMRRARLPDERSKILQASALCKHALRETIEKQPVLSWPCPERTPPASFRNVESRSSGPLMKPPDREETALLINVDERKKARKTEAENRDRSFLRARANSRSHRVYQLRGRVSVRGCKR